MGVFCPQLLLLSTLSSAVYVLIAAFTYKCSWIFGCLSEKVEKFGFKSTLTQTDVLMQIFELIFVTKLLLLQFEL